MTHLTYTTSPQLHDQNAAIKFRELQRIQFVRNRAAQELVDQAIENTASNLLPDACQAVGDDACHMFVTQAHAQYRRALKTPYGRAYRRELINSIIVFRQYMRSR